MQLYFNSSSNFDYGSFYSGANDSSGLQGVSKLQYLDPSDKNLIGSIPGSVSKLVSLEVINLTGTDNGGALNSTCTKTNEFNTAI